MTGRFVDLERAKAERLAKQEKPDAWRRANGNGKAGGATPNMRIITITGGGIADEAEQAEAGLIEQGAPIYRRGAELVRPYTIPMRGFHGEPTVIAALQCCDEAMLDLWLARSARFQKFDGRKNKPRDINPPRHVAAAILRRQDEWHFPSVAGIITTPTLRPDGTILATEGYDPATRLLLMRPPRMPTIPLMPTRADAEAALALLSTLLDEFPFVDEPSRAVALSAIITAVCRGAMPVAPMHGTSAPAPGTGKSYLFDLVALIATGERCPVTSMTASAEENDKSLDGTLLAGSPIFCLDNVNCELGGDRLCQAIERPLIDVRRLGSSDKHKIENVVTVLATGNNVALRGDITRRAVLALLDAGIERPELRQFQRRPDVMITHNRGAYIAAALTVARAYIVAGRPGKLLALASFEEWSDSVRSALVWLGCADPVETIEAARADDPEAAERIALFEAMESVFGTASTKAADIITTAGEMIPDPDAVHKSTLRYPDLHEAVLAIAGRRGVIDADRFAKWLRSNKGRIAAGKRLVGKSGRHTMSVVV